MDNCGEKDVRAKIKGTHGSIGVEERLQMVWRTTMVHKGKGSGCREATDDAMGDCRISCELARGVLDAARVTKVMGSGGSRESRGDQGC